jgi:hypothetical protein
MNRTKTLTLIILILTKGRHAITRLSIPVLHQTMLLMISGFTFLTLNTGISQTPPTYALPANPTNNVTTPPSPDAWAFMKYGSYHVSRESGAVNISIPLHTVTAGPLSVPIELSYQATGIRVDELPSWAGVGWDVNVGGIVSRVVKGYPDELPYGQLNVGIPQSINDFTPLDEQNYTDVRRIIAGEYDAEPDEFNFDAPGVSGKFYLTPAGVAQTMPFTDVKISYSKPEYHITSFEIIASNGIKYVFGAPSVTNYPTNYIVPSVQANTTWYLLEMISPNGTDKISFTYKTKASMTQNRPLESDYITFNYTNGGYAGFTKERKSGGANFTFTDSKALETVTFPNGKVVFNSVTGRSDDPSALKLNSIDVYAPDMTTVVRGFNFQFDYFVSTGGTATQYNYRLRLNSVQERGAGGSLLPPHTFDYEDIIMPPRHSFSQDYWGYYNGRPNGSLMPLYNCPAPAGLSGTPGSVLLGDADRKPYASSTAAGMLKGITYPTGGRTEFTFEPNDAKSTYQKETGGATYSAALYPPPGGGTPETDKYTYIPSEGQAVAATTTYTVNYWIRQITGTINTGDMSVRVQDVTSTPVDIFYNGNVNAFGQTAQVTLTAGRKYRLYVHTNLNQTSNQGIATIELIGPSSMQWVTENVVFGGLRTKRITNYENGSLQAQREYVYTIPDSASYSSGVSNRAYSPTPNCFVSVKRMRWGALPPGPCETYENVILSLTSTPADQVAFANGSPVTYKYVTEIEKDAAGLTKGKSVYKHATYQDGVAQLPTMYQYYTDRSWLRGQLLREEHYNTTTLIRSVNNTYEVIDNIYPQLGGLKFVETWSIGTNTNCATCLDGAALTCDEIHILSQRLSRVLTSGYTLYFQWKRLLTTTETQDGVQSVTSYTYNGGNQHMGIVGAATTGSDGRSQNIAIQYAHEVNETVLLARGMTGIPLRYEKQVAGQLTTGSRTTYGYFGSNYIAKKFEEKLANGSYVDVSEVVEADHHGNPVMVKRRDGSVKVLLWDVNGQLPQAEISSANVSLSSVALNPTYSTAAPGDNVLREFVVSHGQSATITTTIQDPSGAITGPTIYNFYVIRPGETIPMYSHNLAGTKNQTIVMTPGRYYLKATLNLSTTKNIVTQINLQYKSLDVWVNGFEYGDGNSSAGDAATGNKSKTDGYAITLNNLTDGKPYILSYYKKVNGEWTYVENPVTSTYGDYAINLTGQIDEVRLYPKDSHVATVAYDPMYFGSLKTKTDPNGLSTQYLYDSFGRLKLIKDYKNNVIKSLDYHYRQ